MTTIRTFNDFQEFLTYNKNEIIGNYYAHYHFLRTLKKLESKELKLYEFYNIIGDNSRSIMCIWVDNIYYIYGQNWDEEMIQKAVDKIQPQKYRNYTFLGQRYLIDKIFQTANIKIESRRNRIAYSCNKMNQFISNIDGNIENASLKYIDQIIALGIQYYEEEFEGHGTKTQEEVCKTIINSIESRNLYSLRINDTIHSIVTVISYDRNKPMIGSLYTLESSRNKGYAYKLLYEVTKGLLESGYNECGLLSNADNPSSNHIFTKIGYRPLYDLVLIFKKEKK